MLFVLILNVMCYMTHLHLLTLVLGSLLAHCVWYRKFRGRLGEIGNLLGRQSLSYDTVLKHVNKFFLIKDSFDILL